MRFTKNTIIGLENNKGEWMNYSIKFNKIKKIYQMYFIDFETKEIDYSLSWYSEGRTLTELKNCLDCDMKDGKFKRYATIEI